MSAANVEWDDNDEPEEVTPVTATADPSKPAEPGSVVEALIQQAHEQLEEDVKTLQVGRHPRLYCEYRALTDEERAELRSEAMAWHREQDRRTGRGQGRRRKGKAETLHQAKASDAAERYHDALLLATACVEILVEADAQMAAKYEDVEIGELVPLQRVMETTSPVRYNRTLAEFLKLDELLGIDIAEATPAAVVTAMHTFGRESQRSTAPLSTRAHTFKMWNSAVNAEALEEALGGN